MASLEGSAILTTKNVDAYRINNAVLERFLPGSDADTRVYKSIDEVMADDPSTAAEYPTEYLNSLTHTSLPPHELRLKVSSLLE